MFYLEVQGRRHGNSIFRRRNTTIRSEDVPASIYYNDLRLLNLHIYRDHIDNTGSPQMFGYIITSNHGEKFKLKFFLSAFVILGFWGLNNFLQNALDDEPQIVHSLRPEYVQFLLVSEHIQSPGIFNKTAFQGRSVINEEKRVGSDKKRKHLALSEDKSSMHNESTVKILPYSQFSYPLEIDLQRMYDEFKTTGRTSVTLEEVNPHPFKYLLLRNKCEFQTGSNISLLILVKSAVQNFKLRKAIRTTWANVTGKNIEVVFMLGYNDSNQRSVEVEVEGLGDIIQESFLDTYMNNTYKTIMGFNWAVQFCGQASHILFVDDDHYLVLYNILEYIKEQPANDSALMVGLLNRNAPVHRDHLNKWYTHPELYHFDKWPPYLGGGAYIISADVARRFVFSFPYIKYIGIDDCYLGIVARKMGITPRNEVGFGMHSLQLYKDPSHFAYHDFKSINSFKRAMDFLLKCRPKSLHRHKHKKNRLLTAAAL